MSKQSRQQRTERKKTKRQQTILLSVGAVALIGFILLILTSHAAPSASSVSQARLDLDPVLGDPAAPVTLIEYGAYSCPGCRSWHQAGIVSQILADYPGQVRFIFRDFPVINPTYDTLAAPAAQCALDQEETLFWDLHNTLYSTEYRTRTTIDDFVALGESIGLEKDSYAACLQSRADLPVVEYDRNRATRLGLRGTPSFLVNDQIIYNASPEALRAAIDQALGS